MTTALLDHRGRIAPPPPGLAVAVQVRGVSKHFGKGEQRVTALDRVDWDVYKGQFSLIIGPSGCGKTTLLSVIAGILDADEGTVEIFGREVTSMSDRELTRFRASGSASSSSSTTCSPP